MVISSPLLHGLDYESYSENNLMRVKELKMFGVTGKTDCYGAIPLLYACDTHSCNGHIVPLTSLWS